MTAEPTTGAATAAPGAGPPPPAWPMIDVFEPGPAPSDGSVTVPGRVRIDGLEILADLHEPVTIHPLVLRTGPATITLTAPVLYADTPGERTPGSLEAFYHRMLGITGPYPAPAGGEPILNVAVSGRRLYTPQEHPPVYGIGEVDWEHGRYSRSLWQMWRSMPRDPNVRLARVTLWARRIRIGWEGDLS